MRDVSWVRIQPKAALFFLCLAYLSCCIYVQCHVFSTPVVQGKEREMGERWERVGERDERERERDGREMEERWEREG